MKKGAIFINVGRGLVVKEKDLYKNLKEGIPTPPHLYLYCISEACFYNITVNFCYHLCHIIKIEIELKSKLDE